jgi:hypothetical protein
MGQGCLAPTYRLRHACKSYAFTRAERATAGWQFKSAAMQVKQRGIAPILQCAAETGDPPHTNCKVLAEVNALLRVTPYIYNHRGARGNFSEVGGRISSETSVSSDHTTRRHTPRCLWYFYVDATVLCDVTSAAGCSETKLSLLRLQ